MLSRLLKIFERGRDTAAKVKDDAFAPVVVHRGFEIPRRLAWLTGTLKDFTAVSDKHIAALHKYADLGSATDIVEIGCGVGRDAIALIDVLPPDGSYLGVDLKRESIDWARRHIAAKDPRFAFHHFDVKCPQHNADGKHEMATYRIDRADGTVDLVFLFSVFTHMFPQDVSHYLREFERILRPGSRVLASMFIMQDGFREHLLRIGGGGARNLTFQHEVEPGFFHNDPNVMPGATAYTRDRIQRMAAEAGLQFDTFAKGGWSKTPGREIQGQDIVVLIKPRAGD